VRKRLFHDPLTGGPDLAHGGSMNGFLAICCICREITS
jgi:hypothetical protein